MTTILGILRFYWMEGNLNSWWPQMSSIWLLIYQPLPYGLGAEPAHPHREQGNALSFSLAP